MLANKFTPTSPSTQSQVVHLQLGNGMCSRQTHRFLILLFGAAGFLGFLNDSIEGKAQAAHAWQVSQVYVKFQLLIPERLRAHCHLGACHHLTEQFAAMVQTSLNDELEEKHTYTAVMRWRHDMWFGSWRVEHICKGDCGRCRDTRWFRVSCVTQAMSQRFYTFIT